MQFLTRGRELALAAAGIVLDDDAERPAGAATDDPPADDPPADDPPADDPPADDPPVDPPADEPAQAAASDEASIRAEERKRVADVFASDASKGKERVAARLLADTDMPADKIVGLLPEVGGSATDAMLANLAGLNPDLGPGAESRPGEDASASWKRTFKRLDWDDRDSN